MVDIIRFGIQIIVQANHLRNSGNKVFQIQEPAVLLSKLQALIEFIAANRAYIIAVKARKHRLNQKPSVLDSREISPAEGGGKAR